MNEDQNVLVIERGKEKLKFLLLNLYLMNKKTLFSCMLLLLLFFIQLFIYFGLWRKFSFFFSLSFLTS